MISRWELYGKFVVVYLVNLRTEKFARVLVALHGNQYEPLSAHFERRAHDTAKVRIDTPSLILVQRCSFHKSELRKICGAS